MGRGGGDSASSLRTIHCSEERIGRRTLSRKIGAEIDWWRRPAVAVSLVPVPLCRLSPLSPLPAPLLRPGRASTCVRSVPQWSAHATHSRIRQTLCTGRRPVCQQRHLLLVNVVCQSWQMAAASLHTCATVTLNSQVGPGPLCGPLSPLVTQLLSAWNKRFATRSVARPRDRDLQDSYDAAASSVAELVRIGLIDPQVIRFCSPTAVIRPSTRLLVSYASSWSFEQNKRTGSLLFACRSPSPLLLSVRDKPNSFHLRTFRTRAPSAGIGVDRDVLSEGYDSPNRSRSSASEPEKTSDSAGEKGLKLGVKSDDVKGSLSIDEQSLSQEEKERVRVCLFSVECPHLTAVTADCFCGWLFGGGEETRKEQQVESFFDV